MDTNIIEALKSLNLSEKEARVYIALLKLGTASAYKIAQSAGIKKPTTYIIMGELMQKGLVLKMPGQKAQMFSAKHPGEFFAETQERIDSAMRILPQLNAIAKKPNQTIRSFYFEGLSGLQEMYKITNKKMVGKEVVGFYARVTPGAQGLESFYNDELNPERKRLGIKIRGISSNDPSLKEYKKTAADFGYDIHWINPKKYLSDSSIEIGEDFVQIVSHRHLQAVLIENPDVAKAFRQIFELVWNLEKRPTA